MVRPRSSVILATLVAFAVVLPHAAMAATAPATASLESSAPVKFVGTVLAGGPDSRFFGEYQGSDARSVGSLSGVSARYVVWTQVAAAAPTPLGPVVARQTVATEESTEAWSSADVAYRGGLDSGRLRVAAAGGRLLVEFDASEDGLPRVLERAFRPTIATDPTLVPSRGEDLRSGLPAGWFFLGDLQDAGGRMVGFPSGVGMKLHVVGPAVVHLTTGALTLTGDDGAVTTYRLGTWNESDGVTRKRATLELSFADASWAMPLPTKWSLGTPSLEYLVDGEFGTRGATGIVEFTDGRVAVEDASVTMTGTFLVKPRVTSRDVVAHSTTFAYDVEGDVRSVVVDGARAHGGPSALAIATFAAAVVVFSPFSGAGARILGTLYHRIQPSRVLTSPVRARLVEVVREQPGIHVRGLMREADITWGRLLYHLDVLVRARHIALRRAGRYLLVYPVGGAPAEDEVMPPQHPIAQDVVDAVQQEGRIRARDLQRRFGVSRQRLSYHVKKLEAEGKVRVEATPGGLELVPTVDLTFRP